MEEIDKLDPSAPRPATDEELDRAIRQQSYARRVQQATPTRKQRRGKLQCANCPARNRFVSEYQTKIGEILLCVKCADVYRLLALKEAEEIKAKAIAETFQPTPKYDPNVGGYAELFFEVPGASRS